MDDCVRGPLVSFHRLSLYGRELHTIKCESGKFCLFFDRKMFFFLSLMQSFLPAQSVAFFSDATPAVPLPLVLPSRLVARVVSHTFCLRGLPPSRTSPPEKAFQGVDHRIGSIVTDHPTALHILSAITSYRKGRPICTHISWLCCRFWCKSQPMFLPFSFL